jgi:hypothetical protein
MRMAKNTGLTCPHCGATQTKSTIVKGKKVGPKPFKDNRSLSAHIRFCNENPEQKIRKRRYLTVAQVEKMMKEWGQHQPKAEKHFAKQFNVSRTTIKKASELLRKVRKATKGDDLPSPFCPANDIKSVVSAALAKEGYILKQAR